MGRCIYAMVHVWKLQGNLGLSLPFYHVGLKDWTWGKGFRLGGSTFAH